MNKKILVTSIEHDFINTSSKKILLEIPANNHSLIVEIEKEGECVTTNIYALLK
jgi:hypothetical protein